MRFLIVTHVLHKLSAQQQYAYAPYVREMNLWLKHVDEVEIVAPVIDASVSNIDIAYTHNKLTLTKIPAIAFINVSSVIKSILALPYIIFNLWQACKRADHIHLRCPGNIGLLGCMLQIFFPKKIKTAKYAGNWDPKANQPLSYRIQKRILSNTFWTKNMTVLVYGAWDNQTKNIKPFFTATYKDNERCKIETKNYSKTLRFVFVGSLVSGKRPLLAIQIIEALKHKGYSVTLDLYGDGVLKQELQAYIDTNQLQNIIVLHGNQSSTIVKQQLKAAHFTLLASQSEGWPKAIAEAMFFGVIPIATAISCVPNMLDNGNRGILITPNVNEAVAKIEAALSHTKTLEQMSRDALAWSQYYTLDLFEDEIKTLIQNK
ncbi:glycosyltransferase [Postechiella marina]|uniref:Glycosyltransferase n=1 Tax=Postechiella marina TaxID=943941 RepID=A0ABP8C9G2_9FLAO